MIHGKIYALSLIHAYRWEKWNKINVLVVFTWASRRVPVLMIQYHFIQKSDLGKFLEK